MTDSVKIFNNAVKNARFVHAKNAVPIESMLRARGINCAMTRYGCKSENEM